MIKNIKKLLALVVSMLMVFSFSASMVFAIDSDNDGIPDESEIIDSDNDGIPDESEIVVLSPENESSFCFYNNNSATFTTDTGLIDGAYQSRYKWIESSNVVIGAVYTTTFDVPVKNVDL